MSNVEVLEKAYLQALNEYLLQPPTKARYQTYYDALCSYEEAKKE